MPTIVECPSCNRKLRVPDDLIGQMVKCPTCATTFTASADQAGSASQEEAPAQEGYQAEPVREDRPSRRPPPDEEETGSWEDEYGDRPQRRGRRRASYDRAKSMVTAPAICLLVTSGLALALALLSLFCNLVGAAAGPLGAQKGGAGQ